MDEILYLDISQIVIFKHNHNKQKKLYSIKPSLIIT